MEHHVCMLGAMRYTQLARLNIGAGSGSVVLRTSVLAGRARSRRARYSLGGSDLYDG